MRFLIFLLLLVASLSAPARADELTIAAAASLREAMGAIANSFHDAHPQTRVNLTFGSSGTLQKQIERGAPIDVFVAASDKNMDALLKQNRVDKHARFNFARGEMVLIAPRDGALQSLSALGNARNLAIGGPGVPAGDYARQALSWYQLDKTLASKLVYGKDVRGVLALVASGNADAGLVYRTDALSSRSVKIVGALAPQSHAPIRYPMALVKDAPNSSAGRAFVRFCKTAPVRTVLKRYGFGL